MQSSECFHSVHQECFRLNAKQALTEGQDLFCPECGKQISTIEQRQYLSKEELDGIEQSQMQKFLGNSANIKKCPCGAMMEAAQGQVDYNAKDDTGQAMSPAAAIHMSRYRIRCRSCE